MTFKAALLLNSVAKTSGFCQNQRNEVDRFCPLKSKSRRGPPVSTDPKRRDKQRVISVEQYYLVIIDRNEIG